MQDTERSPEICLDAGIWPAGQLNGGVDPSRVLLPFQWRMCDVCPLLMGCAETLDPVTELKMFPVLPVWFLLPAAVPLGIFGSLSPKFRGKA